MTYFCKYRHIFGKENEGVHSYRLFDIAIVDLIMTIILGIIISYFTKINVFLIIFLLILFSIYINYIFCVESKFVKLFKNLSKSLQLQ